MTYQIKKGDTLTSIAKAYNTTVDELASVNGIKNKDLIYAGDSLTIPDSSSSKAYTNSLSVSDAYYVPGASQTSADTQKALAALNEWKSSKPKEKTSTYSKELDSIISSLTGREFSYDAESDPVYKAYRESYMNDARLAMKDALGKAVSLTGGLGNSYADSVANQVWGENIKKGAEIIPELYKAAYNRYSDESDDLVKQAKLLSSLSDAEFEKYNSALKNYLTEGKMLWDNYKYFSGEDYDRFLDYAKLLKSLS